MAIEMIEEETFNQGTQIKVIGVGGGGGNAVEHMIFSDVGGVEFITANTDSQALSRSTAHKTIQLGAGGLGAGSKPDKGREAAMLAEADIRAAIEGAHMLFITAGMGGGTGTGAAPIIAITNTSITGPTPTEPDEICPLNHTRRTPPMPAIRPASARTAGRNQRCWRREADETERREIGMAAGKGRRRSPRGRPGHRYPDAGRLLRAGAIVPVVRLPA